MQKEIIAKELYGMTLPQLIAALQEAERKILETGTADDVKPVFRYVMWDGNGIDHNCDLTIDEIELDGFAITMTGSV